MRLRSGNASCSGRTWPPIRFVWLSAVLRISLIPSSLISRIRPYRVCVAAPRRHRSSTDYPFTSSCSPPRVATTQLLSVTRREAPPARDFHPLCRLTLKRTSRQRQLAHDFIEGGRPAKSKEVHAITDWFKNTTRSVGRLLAPEGFLPLPCVHRSFPPCQSELGMEWTLAVRTESRKRTSLGLKPNA